MDQIVELGLDTFGDVTANEGGILLPHAQVVRNVIAEGVLADQSASTSSGSASTIGGTTRSRGRR